MNIADITREKLEANPYPIYEELRRQHPIVSLPGLDGEWLITTWEGCAKLGALTGTGQLGGGHPFEVEFFGGDNILTMAGDAHAQLRAGIDVVLRPKHVNQFMDDTARDIVRGYVHKLKPLGKGDLVAELFEPISVRVVGNRLGLHDIDDETLRNWFKTLSGGLSHHNIDDEAAELEANTTKDAIDDYLRTMIERLREVPDGSLLSHMIHSGLPEGAAPRTFEDIIPSIRVIILGGFQEPGTAIANTFHGLLSNSEQFAALVADPDSLAPVALQEGMRWITPIGTVERTALTNIEIDGITIPKDSLITLVMASANRDESRFANAEQFDLRRESKSSTVFGYGEHYCAGNFLARALGVAVIAEVARELHGLKLQRGFTPTVTGHLFHGVDELLVEWDPS